MPVIVVKLALSPVSVAKIPVTKLEVIPVARVLKIPVFVCTVTPVKVLPVTVPANAPLAA